LNKLFKKGILIILIDCIDNLIDWISCIDSIDDLLIDIDYDMDL